jgi:hypothetical protein
MRLSFCKQVSHLVNICLKRKDVIPFRHLIADGKPDASTDAGVCLQKRQDLGVLALYVLLQFPFPDG